MNRRPVAMALVHHPVLDRRGDRVTTSVTNLDLHDLARAACTYGVERLYIVTPAAEQRRLVERILAHWREGFGAGYNPHRAEALKSVEVAPSLEEALATWERAVGEDPLVVLTGAGARRGLTYRSCREMAAMHPLMLVFGTGWGLDPALFERGWPVLEAVRGGGSYNHLSVRVAAGIILDRLFGEREEECREHTGEIGR